MTFPSTKNRPNPWPPSKNQLEQIAACPHNGRGGILHNEFFRSNNETNGLAFHVDIGCFDVIQRRDC
jgi:hypothetical protein